MKMSMIEKSFVNSSSHSAQVSRHAEALLQKIELQPGASYLDVGCGNGAAPICLAKTYPLMVTGVDVDPDQIQTALRESEGVENIRFQTVGGTQLPFEDGSFDIVATNKVMHHVPDWQRVFAEMVRVLRPGGYLLFNDLVYPNWLSAIGMRLFGRHAGFPTRRALNEMVAVHRLRRHHVSQLWMQQEMILCKGRTGTDHLPETEIRSG